MIARKKDVECAGGIISPFERIVGVEKSTSQSKEEYLTEKRFADGVKCPYCTGTHIQRNGKARGYQQYICVD